MKSSLLTVLLCFLIVQHTNAQEYGNLPTIKKEDLLNDLELLYQGLDKFHSGMYWYTPKDSVDRAFQEAKKQIAGDMNVLQFYKLMAPLVALSREDHTDMSLPEEINAHLNSNARFMPIIFVFLGKELYCYRNGSDFEGYPIEGKRIETINGEKPTAIVKKIGNLFASDGYIKTVKYSDLEGFSFSKYYFYYYGELDQFEMKFQDIEKPVTIKALKLDELRSNLRKRYPKKESDESKPLLEYRQLNQSTAYIGVHTFSNGDIKSETKEKLLKKFLDNSFRSISEHQIKTVVVDVSDNGGGSEGNEGLLYSYFGSNYQKYEKVLVKSQKAVLDNGVDKPIKLKSLGFLERIFANKKNKDGSLERKESFGPGLKAYRKEPDYKFTGKTYVIISPVTYSGSSEFSNMIYTKNLGTFVGQQTGGGYLGNTSGYSEELILPHSKIEIEVPSLRFVMNVDGKLPKGSGVIPHYEVIPTFEEYSNGVNAPLKYILEVLEKDQM
ncbi:MAG: S41 family peptidase [Bacteroidota bacterium]